MHRKRDKMDNKRYRDALAFIVCKAVHRYFFRGCAKSRKKSRRSKTTLKFMEYHTIVNASLYGGPELVVHLGMDKKAEVKIMHLFSLLPGFPYPFPFPKERTLKTTPFSKHAFSHTIIPPTHPLFLQDQIPTISNMFACQKRG